MSVQVGDRRRFHNDGRRPGEPHTITEIEGGRVHYIYDGHPGDPCWWPEVGDDTQGGYEESTEETP